MTDLRDSLVSDKPPLTSLFLILAVIFIGFVVVGPLLGVAVGMVAYPDLSNEILSDSISPNASIALLISQGIASAVGLILIPALYIRYTEQKLLDPFFKKETNLPLVVGMLTVLAVAFIVSISPITQWNMTFEFPESMKVFGDWARAKEDKLAELTKTLTQFGSVGEFLFGLLVIAVIPAIGEEFVFRGLIQNELWRGTRNVHIAIWTSAFLFSAIHLQFFGFVPRMLLGALFGYLYYWSGNLLVPMISHFLNNGLSLTLIYLQTVGVIDPGIDVDQETSAPLSLVAGCAVAVFALLYFFKKQYSSRPDHS